MAEQDMLTALQRATSPVVDVRRPDLTLAVERSIGLAKLQLFGREAEQQFGQVMGFAPPALGRQLETDGLTVAWMAPGEWLLIGDEALIAERLTRIEAQAVGILLVNDLTHARASFVLGGPAARGALAAHCPLDLWPTTFPVDAVARSLLGDTGMFIARLPDTTEGPSFRIIVDQTMGPYAARLLAGPMPPEEPKK